MSGSPAMTPDSRRGSTTQPTKTSRTTPGWKVISGRFGSRICTVRTMREEVGMSGNAVTCLAALLWVGCPQPVELDAGWAARAIAGVVTDAAGAPVGGVNVHGFHTLILDSQCGPQRPGFRGWDTDENGRYRARISEDVFTRGEGPRCLFIEFLPPEGSGLGSVSIDSMRIHVYDGHDPARRADTLFINVTLPAGEPGFRHRR